MSINLTFATIPEDFDDPTEGYDPDTGLDYFCPAEMDTSPSPSPTLEEQIIEPTPAPIVATPQPPKKVFIVPYRNRAQHKFFFSQYMKFLLEDETPGSYEILFSHQCDGRTFNRGAVKNIGFLAVRARWPEHYRAMTIIFNDVDTIPFHKIFDYETTFGVVKHYYGYEYALGGIVVIKGADFERINGFPCYWGWGMEDNVLQKRCERARLHIDRSVFFKIGSPEMLQLFDGISRIISKKDPHRMKVDNGIDGLKTIRELKYTVDRTSTNPNDNLFVTTGAVADATYYVNIRTFLAYERFEDTRFYNYDLRQPAREIIHPTRLRETKRAVATTDDWSNIPYYPTTKENRENVARHLIATGKPVPDSLRRQIEQDRARELEGDVYNTTAVNSGGAGAGAGMAVAAMHHPRPPNPLAARMSGSVGTPHPHPHLYGAARPHHRPAHFGSMSLRR